VRIYIGSQVIPAQELSIIHRTVRGRRQGGRHPRCDWPHADAVRKNDPGGDITSGWSAALVTTGSRLQSRSGALAQLVKRGLTVNVRCFMSPSLQLISKSCKIAPNFENRLSVGQERSYEQGPAILLHRQKKRADGCF
jgi:hypothetical protein